MVLITEIHYNVLSGETGRVNFYFVTRCQHHIDRPVLVLNSTILSGYTVAVHPPLPH